MKLNNISSSILILVFAFSISSTAAQSPEEPDGVEDSADADLNPAPISDYLIPMLVLGIVTAFILLNRKETTVA